MSSDNSSHTALKLTLKFALNVALVFGMATYVSQYFGLSGGMPAYVIVGALITLLNMFFRPVLNVLLLPLKLFATIIAIMVANGGFVYVVHLITLRMDPALVQLNIYGGPWGWIVVAVCFGLANWILKEMFK
ncbi:phage holin family protein [Candidatus Peribacteria bacterium]|nr:phage holin family protein [Candidatus Peribacteria bacterium]